LIVSAERDARVAELPTEIAAVLPPWLAEELRVVRLELCGIVRSDQHTVELHRPSPFSDRTVLHSAGRPPGHVALRRIPRAAPPPPRAAIRASRATWD